MADVAAQMTRMHPDHAVDLAGQQRDVLFGNHHRLAVKPDVDQRSHHTLRDFRGEAGRRSGIIFWMAIDTLYFLSTCHGRQTGCSIRRPLR
jgi:hypothetical protein